ncbi:MAG: cbb3-type cytochrome oxidase assembly protein CcoS [Pirellulaceae bacterium]|nr:cbb3-type cytochrome oxidase assembly protein CcoS [Pirellulaceae bacterium]
MSVLYVALPVALLLGGSALVACIYCIRQGQYDDLDTPPLRMLIDDSPPPSNSPAHNSKTL